MRKARARRANAENQKLFLFALKFEVSGLGPAGLWVCKLRVSEFEGLAAGDCSLSKKATSLEELRAWGFVSN